MKVLVSEIIKNFDKYKGRLVKGFPGVEDDIFQLLDWEYDSYVSLCLKVKVIDSKYGIRRGVITYRYAECHNYLELIPKLKEIILTKGE